MSRSPRVREVEIQVGRARLTKLGMARFDWRDPYHLAVGLRWPHFILGVLAAELLLNLFFGALYALRPGSVMNLPAGSFAHAFFFSIETLATVGYGVMAPLTMYGHVVSSIEIVVGMGFTAITTGLLFVRISRPRHPMVFARNAVVTSYNGKPALMLRVGNARATPLTNARAELSALVTEHTEEGQIYRGIRQLRLQRAGTPIFAMTWTLIHVLDETSPFSGYDAERMIGEQVRLFLSVEGRDPVLAASVSAMQDYDADDIAFGRRFAQSVTTGADGRITADLRRLHDLEPEDGAA